MVKKVLKRLGIGLGLILAAALVFVPVGWLLGHQLDQVYAGIVYPRVARAIESQVPVDVLGICLDTYVVIAVEDSQIVGEELTRRLFDVISAEMAGKTMGVEYVMVILCKAYSVGYLSHMAALFPAEAMGETDVLNHMAHWMPLASELEPEYLMWPGRN